jgi:sulfite exporter TauE/SafE
MLGRSLWHHAGRVLTYATLGLAAGGAGELIADAGFRRALTIGVGAAIAASAAVVLWGRASRDAGTWSRTITTAIATMNRRVNRSRWHGRVAFGALNALLPCGLLYSALAAAAASGGPATGAAFMLAFGIGTTPPLAALACARLPLRHAARLRRASPIAAGTVGLLLIARGLGVTPPMIHAESHPSHAHQQAPPAR